MSASAAVAQEPFRYRFALGLFQQSTAGVADEGWTFGLYRSLTLSAISALELGVDFARVSAPAELGSCEVISNGLCIGSGGPATLSRRSSDFVSTPLPQARSGHF